jgi:hypothetical protein
MRKRPFFQLVGDSAARPSSRAVRRRSSRPLVEVLECRSLLTATAISAVQQYGVPSVVAIDQTGNLSYNFLTERSGMVVWNGWTAIPGSAGAIAISTGNVLISPVLRPYVFLLNSANNIYFNVGTGNGNWGGWTAVGINVGARAISTGTIPITNQPFVFLINGADNIYYSQQTSSGSWSTWSAVGVNVGALSIATGVIQVSSSPAVFEPYVFMVNGANDVWYSQRSKSGSWTGEWSPVGINVGASSISATTLGNLPYVTMLNGAGNTYLNFRNRSGSWAGWAPVGTGGSGTPAALMSAINADSTIYTFTLNSVSQLYSTYGGFGTTVPWFGLGALPGAVYPTTISAASDPNSAPFAFTIGADGNVYFNDQTSWATWNMWANIGTPP